MVDLVLKLVGTCHREGVLHYLVAHVIRGAHKVQNGRTFTDVEKMSIGRTSDTREEFLFGYANLLLIIMLDNLIERLLLKKGRFKVMNLRKGR